MIVLRERERDLGERRSKLANSGPARAGVRGFFFVQGPNPSSSLCLSLSILFSIYYYKLLMLNSSLTGHSIKHHLCYFKFRKRVLPKKAFHGRVGSNVQYFSLNWLGYI